MGLGIAEQEYLISYLARNTLRDCIMGLSDHQLLNQLQIQSFAQLGFSQQYEGQQNSPLCGRRLALQLPLSGGVDTA